MQNVRGYMVVRNISSNLNMKFTIKYKRNGEKYKL